MLLRRAECDCGDLLAESQLTRGLGSKLQIQRFACLISPSP